MGLTLSYRQLKAILIMASKEIFIDAIINIAGLSDITVFSEGA